PAGLGPAPGRRRRGGIRAGAALRPVGPGAPGGDLSVRHADGGHHHDHRDRIRRGAQAGIRRGAAHDAAQSLHADPAARRPAMSPFRSTVLLATGVLLAAPRAAEGGRHETGFLDRTLRIDGVDHRYQVYVPMEYTPSRRWPVILFLHGSGERGTDGRLQTEIGL